MSITCANTNIYANDEKLHNKLNAVKGNNEERDWSTAPIAIMLCIYSSHRLGNILYNIHLHDLITHKIILRSYGEISLTKTLGITGTNNSS